MNKCYRLVFDEARRMLVPVAELKAARGKGCGRSHGGVRLSAVALLVASLGAQCLPGTALAGGPPVPMSRAQSLLPQGGRVVAGSARIATPGVDQMVIDQSSQRAVIDWQSFNIGAGDTVRFAQPSSTAQALNRVVGLTGTTQILGKLTANGQVFIVNPQGIVFGKGAVVDTAALLASTHDIAPSAFMTHGASLLLSDGSSGTGLVDNEGTLSTAPGGWVALVGDQVKNGGGIVAPGGTVALAAGAQATLALANGQLVSLKLDRAVANAQVIDSGTILANGVAGRRAGQVVISADTAQSLLDQAINITGVVQAGGAMGGDGAATRGGQITVDGGANGAVGLQNATLTVASAAGAGGQVRVTGKQVTLYDAHVNASGTTGGGTILAGGAGAGVTTYGSTLAIGSAEGRGGTAVLTGSTVSVLEKSHIDASGRSGGGTVIVGGDKLGKLADLMCVTLASRTVVDGSSTIDISSSGGNGGFLETSGRSVDIAGTVIGRSLGASGQWLIDPDNLVVTHSTASTATNTSGTWTPVAGGGGSYVLDSALTGANVTLDASGDIYSDSNVVVNDAGYNVTLIAGNVGIEGSWTAANLIFNQSGTGGILGAVTANVLAQTGTLNDYSTGSITGTVTVESGAVFSIYTNSSLARTLGNDIILSGGTVETGGVDGIATGGTLTRSNGVEVINIFDASGTLNTSAWSGNKTSTYLLVAGGGGGGTNWGGGGGAGGVLQGSASATDGSLPVDVGAGGAGATGAALGGNGGNTTFDGLTAEGGGGGAQASSNASLTVGANGGSGGGGGDDGSVSGSGGAGVAGQGNGGGAGIPSNSYPVPGGGGGAGAAGANASSTAGGAGGNGIQESLSGIDTYYGGGGGGGGYYCTTVGQNYGFGSGGLGGGASGANIARASGQAGEANTGGGGGGGAGSGGPGGAGGSGIAIVASDIAGASDAVLTANTTVTLAGTVTLSAGTSSTFAQNISGAEVIAQGVLSGSGNLAQAGAGTLTLTADNIYTGATNVSAGTLQVGGGGTTGSLGTGAINTTGATLAFDLTGSSTQGNSSQLTLNNATVNVLGGNVTLAGSSSGGTAVIISGNNTMNASGGSLTILGNGIDRFGVAVDFGSGALINGVGNVSLLGNLTGITGGGRRSFIFNGNTTFNALDGGDISLTSAINNAAADVAFLQNASGVLATSGNVSFNVQSGADVYEAAFDYVDGAGIWNFSSSNGALTINAPGQSEAFGLNASQPLVLNAEAGGSITVNGFGISAANTSITGGVGTVLINANVGLTGNLAIGGGAGSVTLAGAISGAYELTQNSTGTTILTGTNSYGGTTISAGTLQIGNGGAAGTLGTAGVTDDGNLTFDLSSNLAVSQVISGTGNLTQAGMGTPTLTGANTYAGATMVSAGTLEVGGGTTNNGLSSNTSGVAISGGATFYLNYATAAQPPFSKFTGAGTLTLNSAQAVNGTADWTPPNTAQFMGRTAAASLPSTFTGTLSLLNGRIDVATPTGLGGAAVVNVSNGGQVVFWDGTYSGTAYTYTQNFTLNGNGWGGDGSYGSSLRVSGANVTLSGNVYLSGSTALLNRGGSTNNGSLTFTGPIADLTGVTGSANTLKIYDTTGESITFSGANTFADGISVANGTLKINGAGALGTGSYAGAIALSSGTKLDWDSSASQTLSGVISGAGAVQQNAGSLILTGANMYSGGTTINAGTFEVGGTGTLGAGSYAGAIDLASGTKLDYASSASQTLSGVVSGEGALQQDAGTLILTGANTYTGTTTINGGTLQVGHGGTNGTLGTANVTDDGNLTFNLSSNLTVSQVIAGTGNLTQAGAGTLMLTSNNTYAGATDVTAGALQVGNGGAAGSLARTIHERGEIAEDSRL